MKKHLEILFAAVACIVAVALVGERAARADTVDPEKLSVTFGGFIDTYYGYDFNNPQLHDRLFVTQAERSNEFNVNLAYLEAKIAAERIRGRLALQAGTSVQANYAGEPTVGTVSGPSLAQHLQEATVGYRVADRLWVDAGVFFSHIGFESWISKDNWTYTRSLMADFSPYYETGVKATYEWSDKLSTQLLVLNGWQNISENNGSKALGMELAYAPTSRLSLIYNNFIGNEAGARLRLLNDFIAKLTVSDTVELAASYDVGSQRNASHTANSVWQGFALTARLHLTPRLALVARGEGYFDPNQVIVTTGTTNGLQATGGSLGADVTLHSHVLWRNEFRVCSAKDAVFPSKSQGLVKTDSGFVTSLALWF